MRHTKCDTSILTVGATKITIRATHLGSVGDMLEHCRQQGLFQLNPARCNMYRKQIMLGLALVILISFTTGCLGQLLPIGTNLPATPYTTYTPIAPLSTPILPTAIITPTSSISNSLQNGTLDDICRLTITAYFNFKYGDDVSILHNLFVSSSQNIADELVRFPRIESRTLLELLPYRDWWKKNNPNLKPSLPESDSEYVYFVKYTNRWFSNATPTSPNPVEHLMLMTIDQGGNCKIRDYGW